jgi:hypothetical protein
VNVSSGTGSLTWSGSRSASDGDPAEAAGAVRLALLSEDGPTGTFLTWDGSPAAW